jgi:hypothetical protein
MRARKGFLRRCCTNSTRAQTMKKSYQRGSTVPFRCCRLGYRTFTGLPDSPPGLPTRILSGSARSPGDWLTSLTPHEQSVQSLQGVNNGLLVAGVRSFVSDRAQRKLGESRSHPPNWRRSGVACLVFGQDRCGSWLSGVWVRAGEYKRRTASSLLRRQMSLHGCVGMYSEAHDHLCRGSAQDIADKKLLAYWSSIRHANFMHRLAVNDLRQGKIDTRDRPPAEYCERAAVMRPGNGHDA